MEIESSGGINAEIGEISGLRHIIDSLPYKILIVDSAKNVIHSNCDLDWVLNREVEESRGICNHDCYRSSVEYPICQVACPLGGQGDCDFYDSVSDRWVSSSLHPTGLKTEDGSEIFIIIPRDVTDEMDLKNSLDHQDSLLKHTQRMTGMGSWEYDILNDRMHWSAEMFKITGVQPHEFSASIQEFRRMVHHEDRDHFDWALDTSVNDGIKFNIEHRVVRSDHQVRHVRNTASVYYEDDGSPTFLYGVLHDITETKAYEGRLQEMSRQNAILLQEVHHRVKNNMQLVNSLLNFRDKDQVCDHHYSLEECRKRIMFMAKIHEMMYHSPYVSCVDFKHFMRELWRETVQREEGCTENVNLVIEGEELHLSIDSAIPTGLIMNEHIMNSLMHAFKGMERGRILVEVRRNGKAVEVRFEDNGPGLAEGFDPMKAGSLGFRIIRVLADQVNGKLEYIEAEGTTFVFTFEDEASEI